MAYATSTYLAIAAGAAVVSAIAGAGGAVYSGVKQGQAADYNADVMQQDALAAHDKARAEEEAHRQNVRRILSAQRALYGKSGLSMEGSPLLVMEDSAAQGELDALAIRYGGDVMSAKNRSAANLARMQGGMAKTSGYINAGTTLLSGASSAFGTYGKKG